ncbi:MAG: ankyrin repeat domain-containing protein [Mailhella sp.]|nr:ankyrin repeat domain-containing protein [Mailhella sp.]
MSIFFKFAKLILHYHMTTSLPTSMQALQNTICTGKQAGADVNAKNCIGETPLFRAVGSDNPECVKLLLEAGADVNVEDNMGRTPFDGMGSDEIVALLTE